MMLIYNLIVTAILFILFLILVWNLIILRRHKLPEIEESKLPFVSVLIPARNEELNIENILISLLNQNYPKYEVIVLNAKITQ